MRANTLVRPDNLLFTREAERVALGPHARTTRVDSTGGPFDRDEEPGYLALAFLEPFLADGGRLAADY